MNGIPDPNANTEPSSHSFDVILLFSPVILFPLQ